MRVCVLGCICVVYINTRRAFYRLPAICSTEFLYNDDGLVFSRVYSFRGVNSYTASSRQSFQES